MISQLLDLTRLRLGEGLLVQRGPMDMDELIRQIVEEVEAAHGRKVRISAAGELGGVWDRDRIGLFIANEIAVAHGGTLRIDFATGDETCFSVTLPRRPPEAAVPARERAASPACAVVAQAGEPSAVPREDQKPRRGGVPER